MTEKPSRRSFLKGLAVAPAAAAALVGDSEAKEVPEVPPEVPDPPVSAESELRLLKPEPDPKPISIKYPGAGWTEPVPLHTREFRLDTESNDRPMWSMGSMDPILAKGKTTQTLRFSVLIEEGHYPMYEACEKVKIKSGDDVMEGIVVSSSIQCSMDSFSFQDIEIAVTRNVTGPNRGMYDFDKQKTIQFKL